MELNSPLLTDCEECGSLDIRMIREELNETIGATLVTLQCRDCFYEWNDICDQPVM